MREPKFSVGERVILVSKNRPDLNGQTFDVLMVIAHMSTFSCPFSGEFAILDTPTPGHGYILDDSSMLDDTGYPGKPMAIVWYETSLRKIPPTSEDSFQQMMEKLKQGETEPA